MRVHVRRDDLSGPEIAGLIAIHAGTMLSASPPESCHFLPLESLRDPSVTVWSLWDGEALVGCGALKELGGGQGEIKSMHTLEARRGEGHGRRMLEHILAEARQRAYSAVWLETGTMPAFRPATALYEAYGFKPCGPFGAYLEDPNSLFMHLALT